MPISEKTGDTSIWLQDQNRGDLISIPTKMTMTRNRIKKLIIPLVSILFANTLGCTDNSINKHYVYTKKYSNGNIEYEEFSIKGNDTFDTEYKIYYPDGTLKRVFHDKQDLRNGSDCNFYLNGKMESKGQWIAGRKYNMFYYYDTLGSLRKVIQYINFRDSSISRPNQIINFNENGDTIKKGSFYFEEFIVKDTITKNEDYWFKIRLTAPLFDKAYLKLCDFDEKYNLSSDSDCDVAYMKNFEVMLAPKKYDLGKNVIRGAIVNYQIFKNHQSKDSMAEAIIYFTDSFYVKE